MRRWIWLLLASSLILCGFSPKIPISEDSQYSYCPSTINDLTYYCRGDSNNIVDYIYCYDGADSKEVLAPSETGWDKEHVCDPSVVKGSFKYKEHDYTYLMVFLGCDNARCVKNQIGLAVSDDGYNWIKIDSNPLPLGEYYETWGIGQASIINIEGTQLLFYTEGATDHCGTYVRECDFSDLDNMSIGKKIKINVPTDIELITNADFAMYDNYTYMVCDYNIKNKNDPKLGGRINYIVPERSAIYKTLTPSDYDYSKVEWTKLDEIWETNRNHNCGFVRNEFGYLADSVVLYTGSKNSLKYEYTGDVTNFLSSYRIYEYRFVDYELYISSLFQTYLSILVKEVV